jgi:hypothetical protein
MLFGLGLGLDISNLTDSQPLEVQDLGISRLLVQHEARKCRSLLSTHGETLVDPIH